MSRISVVIPVRNDAVLLKRCLYALGRQTRQADEIIVVDNGCWDESASIARAAGARVVVEACVGIPAATATGFDAGAGLSAAPTTDAASTGAASTDAASASASASAVILARIDADTIVPRNWLEQVERRFDLEPDLTAFTGTGDFYGRSPLVHVFGRVVYLGGYFTFLPLLLGHPPLFGSNFAIRATAWQRVRTEVHRDRANIHDDLDLSFALTPDMRVVYDRRLRVRISARPFSSWSAIRRHVWWAALTIALNVSEHPPFRRRRCTPHPRR